VQVLLEGASMTTSAAARSPRATAADAVHQPPIRVVVVDDHDVVRESIRALLGAEPDMEWVGEASDGAEAAELVARTRPDVVLMDLSMPGTDGVTATQRIVGSTPSPRVLVLTSSADPADVRLSLDAGASAVVSKDGNPATVLAGIRSVARTHD
jgi:DNA-binding NarL/FixJ family response regulator